MIVRAAGARQNERGAVLFFAMAFAGLLVLVFGMVFILGYRSMVVAELRAAADTAAHAAASRLCASTACYRQARGAAVWSLKQAKVHGGLGHSSKLDFAELTLADQFTEPAPWTATNFAISIERGLYTGGSFESFDTLDNNGIPWQERFPGVPNFIAANAVRVEISRAIDIPLFAIFHKFFTVSAESIVVADPPLPGSSNSKVAPFGVPVCTLLDNTGVFHTGRLCTSERYFTEVQRHCSGGVECGKVPDFTWQPISSDGFMPVYDSPPTDSILYFNKSLDPSDNVEDPADPGSFLRLVHDEVAECEAFYSTRTKPPHFSCNMVSNVNCKWSMPHYTPAGDNFGVVGRPQALGGGALSEQNLRVDRSLSVQLGDDFAILESGFTEPESEEALWTEIGGHSRDNEHPPYILSSLAGGADPAKPWQSFQYNKYKPDLTAFPGFSYYPMGDEFLGNILAMAPSYYSETSFGCWWDPPPGKGICNSRRFGPHPSAGFTPIGVYNFSTNVSTNVWEAAVPVIADFGSAGQPCAGVLNANSDSPFVEVGGGHQWKVVGFVRADFFDTDIGRSPPTYPAVPPSAANDRNYDGMVWPYPNFAPIDNTRAGDPDPPWGFPDPCNVVRAKLLCDTNFLAGSPGYERHPYFVR